MADLARVALVQGDHDLATSYAITILDGLQGYSLPGVEEPVQVFLTCYQVLKANRDPRAEALLAAGHALLAEQSAQCIHERRNLILYSFPAHRELHHLWQQSSVGHAGEGN
jgi:hypothetical protein